MHDACMRFTAVAPKASLTKEAHSESSLGLPRELRSCGRKIWHETVPSGHGRPLFSVLTPGLKHLDVCTQAVKHGRHPSHQLLRLENIRSSLRLLLSRHPRLTGWTSIAHTTCNSCSSSFPCDATVLFSCCSSRCCSSSSACNSPSSSSACANSAAAKHRHPPGSQAHPPCNGPPDAIHRMSAPASSGPRSCSSGAKPSVCSSYTASSAHLAVYSSCLLLITALGAPSCVSRSAHGRPVSREIADSVYAARGQLRVKDDSRISSRNLSERTR